MDDGPVFKVIRIGARIGRRFGLLALLGSVFYSTTNLGWRGELQGKIETRLGLLDDATYDPPLAPKHNEGGPA